MQIKSWTAAGAVAAAIVALPSAANAGGWWHNKQVVEIRVGPGVAYTKIVRVPKHQRIQVYECTAWCDVSWGPYHGYVQTKYVVDLVNLGDPRNLTPKHHLPYVTPRFAEHLNVSPVTRYGYSYLTPVYVPPAPGYLTSQVISPAEGYGSKPVGRIWYYQGRWYDRPDYFYNVRE